MFTIMGAMIARRIFKNPINPVTRFCDFADARLVRMALAEGAYYRSVMIRGTKKVGAWRN